MDDSDLPQKLGVQRESLRVLDEAFRISPDNVSLQIYRALVRLHLGDSLTAAGRVEDARRAYLDSVAISEPYLKLGHASLRRAVHAREPAARVERRRQGDGGTTRWCSPNASSQIGENPPTDAPSAASRPARLDRRWG